ncbi:MAG: alpha-glucan family phosphorylase [Acidimicrobiia bacterium]|nr:alpha-glucan family phosphorylase [Acidimicrobiia bacterium]
MGTSGEHDLAAAAAALADRLPEPLAPLAHLAYNYRWSWMPGGAAVFGDLGPYRWEVCGENPVRFLRELSAGALEAAAADPALVERVRGLEAAVREDLARPARAGPASPDHPVAFLCAEFGVHRSLPVYAGGLGVLAGDLLKEASDRALPMVGVGLLYRRGYFHQRVDLSGWQHEYWIEADPEMLPAVRVTDGRGERVTVTVPVFGRDVVVQVWRVDVGRVPLFLLDTAIRRNSPVDRWITARLYEGNRALRLAQYTVLGVGGIRALRALGIDPAVIHLNEGHAALAALELAGEEVERGRTLDQALAATRRRVVFTTHTPVPAGNETYPADEILHALPGMADRLGTDPETFLGLGRVRPEDRGEPAGMTPLAIRSSRAVNGVSRRHGEVARAMWQPLFPSSPVERVPITHVTNGVHLPTWMAGPMRALLDRHLGDGWVERAADPRTWERVAAIPDEELWATRVALRTQLVEFARGRSVRDRLARGEPLDYVEAAAKSLDPDVLTVGFARRVASYKRLDLLTHDPVRALALLDGPRPLQLLFAGKAHPLDDGAKAIVRELFRQKSFPRVGERVAFLEDYDLGIAGPLVAGCDVWVNLPLPPLEASGTSGMKAALNGGLNLSVLDGWWAEAHDGTNGWAISGEADDDRRRKDAADAAALYDLLEHEVVPLFHDRDGAGVPEDGWPGSRRRCARWAPGSAPPGCSTTTSTASTHWPDVSAPTLRAWPGPRGPTTSGASSDGSRPSARRRGCPPRDPSRPAPASCASSAASPGPVPRVTRAGRPR